MIRRHPTVAAVAVALAVGLTGCTAAAPTAAPAPAAAPAASVSTAAARPAIATRTVPLAPEYGGTITYSVLTLSVQEKLTVLELELRADSNLDDGANLSQVIGTRPRPGHSPPS